MRVTYAVLGNAATQVANGLHLLGMTQCLLSLEQTLLGRDPFADVVGEQVGALNNAIRGTQAIEAQLVMPLCSPIA